MKKFLQLGLLLNFVWCHDNYAAIYEINKLKEVLGYLQPGKAQIVVFDIDNTLLRAPSDLGSDQWVSCIVKQNISKGLAPIQAWDQILPTYFHIHRHINLVTTEPNLVDTVSQIEQACDHTICLTARSSMSLVQITLDQLTRNNLNFHVPEINHAQLNLPGNAVYQDGVLFCGHSCKGQVLKQFLAACHYQPVEIILVDDKEYNLLAVQDELAKSGIEFTGLRYAGCDGWIASLDMAQAQQELEKFLVVHPLV